MAVKTTCLNYSLGGGQFAPDLGGQFTPDLGGQFAPAKGGQLYRIFHLNFISFFYSPHSYVILS
jgi:hypothetical protein